MTLTARKSIKGIFNGASHDNDGKLLILFLAENRKTMLLLWSIDHESIVSVPTIWASDNELWARYSMSVNDLYLFNVSFKQGLLERNPG